MGSPSAVSLGTEYWLAVGRRRTAAYVHMYHARARSGDRDATRLRRMKCVCVSVWRCLADHGGHHHHILKVNPRIGRDKPRRLTSAFGKADLLMCGQLEAPTADVSAGWLRAVVVLSKWGQFWIKFHVVVPRP